MTNETTNEQRVKNQAIYWALETHPNRFNVAEKPSAEELIEIAKKFESYLMAEEGVRD